MACAAFAALSRRCSTTCPTRRRCCSDAGSADVLDLLDGRARGDGRRAPAARARTAPRSLTPSGRGLGAAGVPVISGLALGIDGTAHRGCLDGGGVPVAVVASGPDVVYPRRHRSLHERVRAAGLVLSELPPGTEPYRWSFPARNRIMAGLARMTLVVEAADPSGSLITAEFAKDLGRCVAAVPGRITSSVARGTNNLLKDGATPISGTEDVLDELFGVGVRRAAREARRAHGPDDPVLPPRSRPRRRCDSVEAVAAAIGLPISRTRARRWAGSRSTATSSGAISAAGSARPDDRPSAPARRSWRGAGRPASRGAWVRDRRAELPDAVRGARHRRPGRAGARLLRGEDAHRPARHARRARAVRLDRGAQAAAGAGDGARVARPGQARRARGRRSSASTRSASASTRRAGCCPSSTSRAAF